MVPGSTPSSAPGTPLYTDRSVTPDSSSTSWHGRPCRCIRGQALEVRVGGVRVDSGLAGAAHRLVATEQVLHSGGGHQGARPQGVGGDALVAQLLGQCQGAQRHPVLGHHVGGRFEPFGSSRTGGDSVRMCGFCLPTMCGMHACDTAYVPRTWIPFIRSKRFLSGTSVTERQVDRRGGLVAPDVDAAGGGIGHRGGHRVAVADVADDRQRLPAGLLEFLGRGVDGALELGMRLCGLRDQCDVGAVGGRALRSPARYRGWRRR